MDTNYVLQDIAIIMYKAKYNICPPYIKDLFKREKISL